jgi:cytochrome c biogenesis protein CcdA
MLALLGAFVAGVLTTLAPCVLPLLPVIVGSSVAGTPGPGAGPGGAGGVATATRVANRRRAVVIAASLGVSIIVFTLALKATTALLGIPPEVWPWVSGGLLVALGLVSLFPGLWEGIAMHLQLQSRSTARLSAARQKDGLAGQILTGAALGPVFTSCSPLYGYVIVTVLPADFWYGLLLLVAYVAGLSGTLLAVSLLGQRFIAGARWAADPHGWFRRGLGLVFVVLGVLIATGGMREIETWLIDNSPIQPWNLDQGFIPE